MRNLTRALLVALAGVVLLVLFAPAASAGGWTRLRNSPAVVACYDQINSPYGALRRVRTSTVNDTSSWYLHWATTTRKVGAT